jgi:hypothetical protein
MKRKGVSLLETVAAATILASSVMTICGLSARGLRSIRLNQEYEQAWDYLDRQLVLIDTAGVNVLTEGMLTSGQFESYDGRTWRWSALAEESELIGLYDVVVQVEWVSGGKVNKVRCQTRLCGQPEILDETTMTEGTTP